MEIFNKSTYPDSTDCPLEGQPAHAAPGRAISRTGLRHLGDDVHEVPSSEDTTHRHDLLQVLPLFRPNSRHNGVLEEVEHLTSIIVMFRITYVRLRF